MPPPSAYTPFESLLFFQSLAALDSRPASFASISDTLRSNPFIRQNDAFNPDRLSPEALEELYATLVRDPSATSDPTRRADSPVTINPKKRKVTSPRPEGLVDQIPHAAAVPDLVSHLYARYKELVTREIRNEEKRFRDIRDEIERLQNEAQEAAGALAAQEHVPQLPRAMPEHISSPMDNNVKHVERAHPPTPSANIPVEPKPAREEQVEKPVEQPQVGLNIPQPPAEPTAPMVEHGLQPQPQPIGQPQNPTWQPPQPVSQLPATLPTQPSHPPQANGTMSLAQQQPGLPATQGPTSVSAPAQAPPPGAQPPATGAMPAPSHLPVPSATSAGKEMSAVAGPVTAPVRTQDQPHFQQWALNEPPQTPHPPVSSRVTVPQSLPAASKKPIPPVHPQNPEKSHAGKPYQPPYPSAVPTTPVPAPAPVHTPVPVGYGPGYEATSLATLTSFSEPRNVRRRSVDAHISLTPWKKLPRLSIPERSRSPVRPRPEDISPISDRAPSPIELPEEPSQGAPPRRRKRRPVEEKEPNAAATDIDGRATKRTKTDRTAPPGRRKRDGSTPPSRGRRPTAYREEGSPIEPASQARIKQEATSTPVGVPDDTESTTRAASERKGGAAAAPPARRPGRGRPKRKRSVSETLEQEPAQPEPSRPDPNQYVLCARNFPRTGAPIMNEVTAHKHASIFTKPLTERDAPGYRDLIYRPQDLKSIKSSISLGSKGVTAASEAMSTPAADGESPVPAAGTPSKNAVLMLQKTEDLIPPKAIVNSAQLEKELIRMFANAVMYNPTPQRGFGPAFPMISDSGSRASTEAPEADEGGIVNDALEMFDDVEKAVTRWRAAERTADEPAHKSVLAMRKGSVSDLNPDSADDSKG